MPLLQGGGHWKNKCPKRKSKEQTHELHQAAVASEDEDDADVLKGERKPKTDKTDRTAPIVRPSRPIWCRFDLGIVKTEVISARVGLQVIKTDQTEPNRMTRTII